MYATHARIQMGADTSGLNPSEGQSDFVMTLDEEIPLDALISPSTDPFAMEQATRPFWSYLQP
jgi:hypothetical protein